MLVMMMPMHVILSLVLFLPISCDGRALISSSSGDGDGDTGFDLYDNGQTFSGSSVRDRHIMYHSYHTPTSALTNEGEGGWTKGGTDLNPDTDLSGMDRGADHHHDAIDWLALLRTTIDDVIANIVNYDLTNVFEMGDDSSKQQSDEEEGMSRFDTTAPLLRDLDLLNARSRDDDAITTEKEGTPSSAEVHYRSLLFRKRGGTSSYGNGYDEGQDQGDKLADVSSRSSKIGILGLDNLDYTVTMLDLKRQREQSLRARSMVAAAATTTRAGNSSPAPPSEPHSRSRTREGAEAGGLGQGLRQPPPPRQPIRANGRTLPRTVKFEQLRDLLRRLEQAG